MEPQTSPGRTLSICYKTYRTSWENDPLLKTWIARHPSEDGKVVCRFCNYVFRAHKRDLLEHTTTQKHGRNFQKHVSPDVFNKFMEDLKELKPKTRALSRRPSKSKPTFIPLISLGNYGFHFKSETNTVSLTESEEETNGSTESQVLNGDVGNTELITFHSGDLEENAIESVICNEDLWSHEGEEFTMSTDSPSDLVSVILEEQLSPQSPTSATCLETSQDANIITNLTATDSKNLKTLNEIVLGDLNFKLLNETTLGPHLVSASSNNDLMTETQPKKTLPLLGLTAHDNPIPAEVVTNDSHILSNLNTKDIVTPLSLKDIITAIEAGVFSLPDLWSLAKTALNKIEENNSGRVSTLIEGCDDSMEGVAVPMSLASTSSDSCEFVEQSTIRKDGQAKKRRVVPSTMYY